jgi:hypothetical protein
MLICVDGTGRWSDKAYFAKNDQSFVSTIYYESRSTAFDQQRSAALPPASAWPSSGGPHKLYRRGPDFAATGNSTVRPESLAALVQYLWNNGDRNICMAGWSRGGAIVIATAAWLKTMKPRDGRTIEVEALFLFDAVDRAVQFNAKAIPSNVRHCYHAVRDQRSRSRESFGNCGLLAESQRTKLVTRNNFFTTHGGMGGVPWGERGLPPRWKHEGDPTKSDQPFVPWSSPAERLAQGCIDEGIPDGPTKVTVAQEWQQMMEVQSWMWGYFRQHGVIVPRPVAEFGHA